MKRNRSKARQVNLRRHVSSVKSDITSLATMFEDLYRKIDALAERVTDVELLVDTLWKQEFGDEPVEPNSPVAEASQAT